MFDPLRSLSYVSTPTRPFDTDALFELANGAARSNALNGITGLLLFNGHRFCQTAEGGVDAIALLMERLLADPRHENLTVLSDQVIDARRFGMWRMRPIHLVSGADHVDPIVSRHLSGVDPHRWFWAKAA